MKKIIIILSAIIMAACSTEEDITFNMNNSSPTSRSSITDESTTNPTLMTDWENVDEITLYNGARVAAPWVQGTTLSSTSEFATDIKKEDGWVMLYHTFKALNTYPNVNYIALYNRLTGFLKFFYYLESNLSNNNGGMWYYQTSNGMPTSLFNLNNYVALPNDASNKYNSVATSNISTTPTDGFKNGWNGFEIEVPYTTDYTNIPFTLSSYNQRVITHEFTGLSNSETTGTITRTVNKESGLFKAISTISGWGAKEIVNKFIQKDTSEVNKGKIGTKILNEIANLSSGDYTSAISAGLKFLFGSSTVVDTAKVNLTTNTKIQLSGQSTEITTGTPITNGLVYLHEAVERTIGEDQFLGVWTLSTTPKVAFSRYSRIDVHYFSWSAIQRGTLYFPTRIQSPLNVVINPKLTPYITQQSITHEVVTASKMGGVNQYNIWDYYTDQGDFIYSDEAMELYEMPFSKAFYQDPNLQGLHYVDGYDHYYDWGTNAPDAYVVITVDLTYNYNGKNKRIVSSRTYKADGVIDTTLDNQILRSGPNRNAFVANTRMFPLEGRELLTVKGETEIQEKNSSSTKSIDTGIDKEK